MAYICPVCGYPALSDPPVNFSICPSCGTEFGLDDAKMSHAQLRRDWIDAGTHWFSSARHPPATWNPVKQLIGAGYSRDLPYRAVPIKLPVTERKVVSVQIQPQLMAFA